MKILLIKPPINRYKNKIDPLTLEPPLGLMYISSSLKAKGYREIKIVHMDAEEISFQVLSEIMRQYRPGIIGISALTAEALGMHQVASMAKKECPDSLVVAGGPHCTAYFQDSLSDHNIDIIVEGEGEQSFCDIVKNYEYGGAPDQIAGIGFRRNGDIVRNVKRSYIWDLDRLPYPDWGVVNGEVYRKFKPQSIFLYGQRYMPLFTSRGCPFHCIYCHNGFGKKFRAHSPDRVMEEIKILYHQFGIVHFEILDDIFNFEKSRAVAILKKIIESKLKINLYFVNGVRGDILDKEIMDLFPLAGVVYIAVAIETASPRLQKTIKKHLNLKKIKKNIAYLTKKHIFVNGFFMLGFPGETLGELLASIKFAVISSLHTASFFMVKPFGGTELGERLEGAGKRTLSIFDKSRHYYTVCKDSVNCSEFSFMILKIIFCLANLLFYLHPRRLFQIIRCSPNKKIFHLLFLQFFLRVFCWQIGYGRCDPKAVD